MGWPLVEKFHNGLSVGSKVPRDEHTHTQNVTSMRGHENEGKKANNIFMILVYRVINFFNHKPHFGRTLLSLLVYKRHRTPALLDVLLFSCLRKVGPMVSRSCMSTHVCNL
jgi:hypothetical protein